MIYPEIMKGVSEKLNIPLEVVDGAYKSFWEFIKQTIQSLPLKEDISEEEFNKLRTNFNVPSLGKLYCTYDRMEAVKKNYNNNKELKDAES